MPAYTGVLWRLKQYDFMFNFLILHTKITAFGFKLPYVFIFFGEESSGGKKNSKTKDTKELLKMLSCSKMLSSYSINP